MHRATTTPQPLVFYPRHRTRLARWGDWMAIHRRAILAIQWVIVLFYAVLVVAPAMLPTPHPDARLLSDNWGASSFVDAQTCLPGDSATPTLREKSPVQACWYDRLVLLAQYLFWGVWWPFVILSNMLLGRVWCGVLCPEGALAEFASRHGRGGAIPRWMRWSGWPFVAFVLTTVYGQLISVYEYPQAALLVLGGSTVAAVAVGWLYGRGKRVWCRYLCPVSGVFGLLARLSALEFRVDRSRWLSQGHGAPAVDCAPLLNVGKLNSMSQCHSCGRCSGHRGAVELVARSPNQEPLSGAALTRPEIALLYFGMLGVALAAFQWTVNPWFVRLKLFSANWALESGHAWLLSDSPSWWILTRQPQVNDVFNWLDGGLILGWILGGAALLGGVALAATRASAAIAAVPWRRLASGWIPMAGLGLFLGLSMMTVTDLRIEGVWLGWVAPTRVALLALAWCWSAWLGWRVCAGGASLARRLLAMLPWSLALTVFAANWTMVLLVW